MEPGPWPLRCPLSHLFISFISCTCSVVPVLHQSLSQSFHTPFNSFVSSSIPYSLTLIFAINQNIVHLSLRACEPCSSQWPTKRGTAWILMSLSQHVETSLGTDSSLPLRSLLESKKQIRRNGRQLFSLSQSIFPWSQRPQLKNWALFLVCVLLFTKCTFSTFGLRVCRGSERCCCILFQANRSWLK